MAQRNSDRGISKAFEQLRPDDRFSSGSRVFTEADVLSFAEQTGDAHPQHVDIEWSKQTRFGERIVHGMLVLSCAIALVPVGPEWVVALRRISEVLFLRPVKLGDAIRVEGTVAALNRTGEGAGLVTLKLLVFNQERRPVCRAKVEVLWRTADETRPEFGG